jgi:hypothetical protein
MWHDQLLNPFRSLSPVINPAETLKDGTEVSLPEYFSRNARMAISRKSPFVKKIPGMTEFEMMNSLSGSSSSSVKIPW